MSDQESSREEALRSLKKAAGDLAERNARPTQVTGAQAASQAYRILAELLGGVLVGLAIGFVVDRYAGTNPWGVIGGVLIGFAVSIWMARRTANRLMAQAAKEGAPKSVPFDDEED